MEIAGRKLGGKERPYIVADISGNHAGDIKNAIRLIKEAKWAAYCHDNELNWLEWGLVEKNAGLLRFFHQIIAFRRAHIALRSGQHLHRRTDHDGGYPAISWHGTRAWNADWNGRVLAFLLRERPDPADPRRDQFIYVAMNMYWEALPFELPRLPHDKTWHVSTNTGMPSPEDIFAPGTEPALGDQGSFLAGGRSVVILVGR